MLGGARIYYFTKSKDVKPFPPGLRMVSGTAQSRNASAYQPGSRSHVIMTMGSIGFRTQLVIREDAPPFPWESHFLAAGSRAAILIRMIICEFSKAL